MDRLAISVLGMPRIEYAGRPLAVDRRKAVALLIYLATTGGAHGRDALATLLWPGYDQSTARGNLRRTLSALHMALGEEWLAIDRDSVALRRGDDLWADAAEFERLLAECRAHSHPADQVCPRCLAPLSQAAALYRDDFLTGFTLPDAPDFDDWQRYQTESLRGTLSGALERLARCLAGQGDFNAALAHVRRRVALDPLDENSQRQLMQVLAWAGDRGAALRQYGACVELLRREVQAGPAPETTALNDAISQNRLTPPTPLSQLAPHPPPLPMTGRGGSAPPSLAGKRDGGLGRVKEQLPELARSETGQSRSLSKEKGDGGVGGELRPVTILCAGLAGEAEPEATAAGLDLLLASLETILDRYAARLDRLLGDSVVAVFGAGQTHEDDAERAVGAALALIEAWRGPSTSAGIGRASVSAGIATGEAYFGPVGAGGHVGVSVLGPLVNRAARLQGRAAAGQALADQPTYRQTHQAFRYRVLGENAAPTQTQSYLLEGAQARPAKTRGIEGLRAALTGREEELAKLSSALAKVRAGQGQVALLIGEAGLGKSRLVAELKAISSQWSVVSGQQSARAWLEGRCLEMAASTSYGPFVDLLRGYFGAATGGDVPCDPAMLACAVRDGLRVFQDAGLWTAEQVEEIGPLLGNLLSLRFGDDWDDRLRMADPGQIRHCTFAALRAFFGALARRQPTALVLEDLHWADSLSLDLIGELLGLLTDHPLLLLCVYRPGREYPSERLAAVVARRCPDRTTELRLHALTPDESQQMLASLLAVEGLPAQARELIVARGEGNPFFTEEVVRALIDAGLLYREGARWRAREQIALARAPEGVQAVILSRVDRLAVGDKQVLQGASVLGRLFRLSALARLVESELNVAAALDRLAERDFVYLERSWPEAEYSFKHVLTQEAVYGTLLAARKTQLHRQAGAALEALYADSRAEHYEALAHHYDRGDVNEKAVEYLLKAGEKARRAYLNDEAIGYFERALARCERAQPADGQSFAPGVEPQRARTPQQVGDSRIEDSGAPNLFGGFSGQGEECAAARLEALTGLGKVHFLAGRFVEAESWLRQAISLGRELRLTPAQLARLYFWLDDSLWWQSRHQEMVMLAEEGLALLGGASESVEALLLSTFIFGGFRLTGEYARALEVLSHIASYIGRLPYNEEFRSIYGAVVMLDYLWHKDAEGGQRWLHKFEEQSRRHHDRRAQIEALMLRGALNDHLGNYRAAVEVFEDALGESSRIGDVPNRLDVLKRLCQCCLRAGRLDEAETWARRSLEIGADTRDVSEASWAAVMRGVVRLCAADDISALHSAGEISKLRLQSRSRFLITLQLAELYLGLGRRTDARALYETMFHDFEPKVMCLWWRRDRLYPALPAILRGLEEACSDSAAFQTICRDYQARHPEATAMSFPQWYLEPADIQMTDLNPRRVHDFRQETVESLLAAGWRWHDSYADCSYALEPTSGLVVRAANGRDLFLINQSAPRFLLPASGDLVAEAVCLSADDRPALGGLLLWLDKENYVRVEWGRYGRCEVVFDGCVANQDAVFGRGCLPGRSEKVRLRLARRGARVDALCSADGEIWWSVGHAVFPVADPVQIGVCASGMIDRTIYPGAYREGTAIRFEALRVW